MRFSEAKVTSDIPLAGPMLSFRQNHGEFDRGTVKQLLTVVGGRNPPHKPPAAEEEESNGFKARQ